MPVFNELKRVNRNTRSGYNGKHICCPKCYSLSKVFHFSWSALQCQSCGADVNKNDWRIHPTKVSL